MQRLISDSLVLIATHTEDSRVACIGFYYCVIHTAHAREFKLWCMVLSNRETCFRKRGFPGGEPPETNTSRHKKVSANCRSQNGDGRGKLANRFTPCSITVASACFLSLTYNRGKLVSS